MRLGSNNCPACRCLGVRNFVRYTEIAGRSSLMLGWLPPFWLAGTALLGVGAEDTVKQWVKWNKCGIKPDAEIVNQLNDGVKVFIHTYTNCKSGKPVRFLKLEGAGHGWPGKLVEEKPGFGKFTTEISANEEIWKFFESLPRKN